MVQVGLKELRHKLSEYIQQIKNGEQVVIIEHNKPIIAMYLLDENVVEPIWKSPRKRYSLSGRKAAAELYLQWKKEDRL